MMTVFNLHLFDAHGECLFSLNPEDKNEYNKLLYGFLYSLKSFAMRLNPNISKDNLVPFFTYHTSTYQLIFLEMATSLKMVLIVAPDSTKNNEYYKQLLREFHRQVYVDYVVKNPIQQTGTPIDSLLFRDKAVEFISKL